MKEEVLASNARILKMKERIQTVKSTATNLITERDEEARKLKIRHDEDMSELRRKLRKEKQTELVGSLFC
jgi:hypothetical protein